MPLAPKLLQAIGVASTAATALYKVGTTRDPNATGGIVSNIRLYNTSTTTAAVISVFSRGASASLPLVSFVKSYTLNAGDFILLRVELALEKDAIVGIQSSVADIVTAVVCGAEVV